LTKSITSSDNLYIQRRCAPRVIGELEIADRFQMKSPIDFVKIRITGSPFHRMENTWLKVARER
jgi:hypothetical protein